jgi:site-specific recombinase XerD
MAKSNGGWACVDQRTLTGYLHGELFQRRRLSEASISRQIETLRKFYRWLNKKGFIDSPKEFNWSYKHLFGHPSGDRAAFSAHQHSFNSLYIDLDDFRQILSGNCSSSSFIQYRNEITMQLGYECGLRAHELLLLKVTPTLKSICNARERNNGLWAASRISIVGKGGTIREIYLPPLLAEKVYGFIKIFRDGILGKSEYLICHRNGDKIRDPKFGSNVFSLACARAGLARHHKQGFHRLRKSFGTNLVKDCYTYGRDPWVEVPRRMGHKNFRTTVKYIQFDALLNHRTEILSELAMRGDNFNALKSLFPSKYE